MCKRSYKFEIAYKSTNMDIRQIKEEINEYINHADERFIRLVYSMVEHEKTNKDFFCSSNDEMIERAKKSMQSINDGNTRNIHDFKNRISYR